MTTASSRRTAWLAAALVLLVGFFLAIVVLEPRTCGMDEFDCFGSRNIHRYLTGFGSVLIAAVIVALGLAAHED
jgi:uncharacterized membrane protein YidH (DUF202 family)